MDQQLAELVQHVRNLTQGLETERQARAVAEAQIQQLHNEGIQREAAATQLTTSSEARIAGLTLSTPSVGTTNQMNVVDTRLLGKPERFDGSNNAWREWKFTCKSYLCAIDSTFKSLLDKAEVAPGVINNQDLATDRERQLSSQL